MKRNIENEHTQHTFYWEMNSAFGQNNHDINHCHVWRPAFLIKWNMLNKITYTKEATKIISHRSGIDIKCGYNLYGLQCFILLLIGVARNFTETRRTSSMWNDNNNNNNKNIEIDEPTRSRTIRTDQRKIGIKRTKVNKKRITKTTMPVRLRQQW